jgi:hypothetical protein
MMDYGAHLPLIAMDGRPWSLRRLLAYAEVAERAFQPTNLIPTDASQIIRTSEGGER